MAGSTHDAICRRTSLSRALKALRRRRGLTVVEVAEALGMALRSYEHFESGRCRVNVDRVHAIATALGADPFAILAAAELGSPEFAARCADNKLMTIFMMALQDFDAASADQISLLDPQTLMAAFDQMFRDLADQARARWALGNKRIGPSDPEDPGDTDA
jgi:transcriptional regulator with XRE-family HTH domain